jgi:hypothetical protein
LYFSHIHVIGFISEIRLCKTPVKIVNPLDTQAPSSYASPANIYPDVKNGVKDAAAKTAWYKTLKQPISIQAARNETHRLL